MDKGILILLVDESTAGVDSIRRVLADQAPRFRLQRVNDVPTALARVLGGGVDILMLNLPAAASPHGERLLPLRQLRDQLREGAQGLPIVVLCGAADKALGEAALREGATDYLVREAYGIDLLRVLRSVSAKNGSVAATRRDAPSSGRGGRTLAFMGSKGGAGTTTVALNVAAALAENQRVILADFHPDGGTLAHYFQPHRSVAGLGELLHSESTLESCLWHSRAVPGLQVLFGPRNPEEHLELTPANIQFALAALTEAADYVVADIPTSLSDTSRALIEDAALLSLVVERDSLAVDSARFLLRAVDAWKAGRVSLGMILVNRAALVSPLPLAEIEAQLALPLLGVIPPAADLCGAAQNAHSPLLTFEPDCLPAIALRALSQCIAQQFPLPRSSAASGASTAQRSEQGMYRAGAR
ncbi:MAG: AAA family ATPase [Acidobacteriota bacterium]|nr:AAA family ATPase [Acidobacteriota bacterium]